MLNNKEDVPEHEMNGEAVWFDALAALEAAERAELAAQKHELAALQLKQEQLEQALAACRVGPCPAAAVVRGDLKKLREIYEEPIWTIVEGFRRLEAARKERWIKDWLAMAAPPTAEEQAMAKAGAAATAKAQEIQLLKAMAAERRAAELEL